jgi:cytochrome c-type biogenesis protein CcsB
MSLTWLAFLLHAGAVLLRGLAVMRPPWGNMFEFATAGAAVVTVVFLVACLRKDLRYLGLFITGPVLLTLGLAVSVLYTQAGQLVPALKSYWLAIHVSIAFISSALLVLAFSATVLYLVQSSRETRRAAGTEVGGNFMDALPSAAELDQAAYRLHAIAFPLWTFTIVAGAIWAESAWGHYWGWDPKEVWSFVIWVIYAGYLHARATRGWGPRKAAYIACVGFAALLFNFLVVNIFIVGLHSYAGVS